MSSMVISISDSVRSWPLTILLIAALMIMFPPGFRSYNFETTSISDLVE
jgi:hypothetical protein